MRSDKLNVNSNSFGEDNIKIIEITGGYTLTADDSGSCLLINAPAACSVKLPLAKGNACLLYTSPSPRDRG